MTTRRILMLVCLSLVAFACANQDDVQTSSSESVGSDSAPVVSSASDEGLPPQASPKGTADEFCNGGGDAIIEMAFVATITHIDQSQGVPWTTFAVSEWFTTDLGPQVELWSVDFEGQVGEQWLIASSRFSDTTGDVFWCDSELFTDELYLGWTDEYGAPIAAGVGVGETPLTTDQLVELEANRTLWQESQPEAYTYEVQSYVVSGAQPFEDRCGLGAIRVIVVDREIESASPIGEDCEVDFATVPRLGEGFDLVVRGGRGLEDAHPEYDLTYGYVRSFYTWDRAIEVSIFVSSFSPTVLPISEDPLAELEVARAKWEAANIDDYTWTVDRACFCAAYGELEVQVVEGIAVAELEQYRIGTVEQLFDVIAANRNADSLDVVYDPDNGIPLEVRIDMYLDAVDDEVDYFVRSFEPQQGVS